MLGGQGTGNGSGSGDRAPALAGNTDQAEEVGAARDDVVPTCALEAPAQESAAAGFLEQGLTGANEATLVDNTAPSETALQGFAKRVRSGPSGAVYVLHDRAVDPPDNLYDRANGMFTRFNSDLTWQGEVFPRLELASYDSSCEGTGFSCRLREVQAFVIADFLIGTSGDLFLVGRVTPDLADVPSVGGTDAFLVRMSGEGEIRWVSRFGSTRGDFAQLIRRHSDGTLVILGSGGPDLDESDFVSKHDADGNVLWMRGITHPTVPSRAPQDIAVDSQGNTWVAYHEMIYVFDPDGTLLRRVDSEAISPVSMQVASDGLIFASTTARGGLVAFMGCGPVQWQRTGLQDANFSDQWRSPSFSFLLSGGALYRGGRQEINAVPVEVASGLLGPAAGVSRYELDGSRRWHRMLAISPAPRRDTTVPSLDVMPTGEVLVLLASVVPADAIWTLAKLDAQSGEVLGMADLSPARALEGQ